MIKRHQQYSLFIIISLGLVALLWIFGKDKKVLPTKVEPTSKTRPVSPSQIDIKERKIDGKPVIGLHPGKEEEELKDIQLANEPTDEWEEKLEETLRSQGGSALKEVIIRKTESLIWLQDGVALNVESATVNLKDDKGYETKFRVLVDSQTGKILKNWDQPVVDPINPRENFGLKLDPRYHQD